MKITFFYIVTDFLCALQAAESTFGWVVGHGSSHCHGPSQADSGELSTLKLRS
jgi:hypothetical protein